MKLLFRISLVLVALIQLSWEAGRIVSAKSPFLSFVKNFDVALGALIAFTYAHLALSERSLNINRSWIFLRPSSFMPRAKRLTGRQCS
jgi:hypothetical protein